METRTNGRGKKAIQRKIYKVDKLGLRIRGKGETAKRYSFFLR